MINVPNIPNPVTAVFSDSPKKESLIVLTTRGELYHVLKGKLQGPACQRHTGWNYDTAKESCAVFGYEPVQNPATVLRG